MDYTRLSHFNQTITNFRGNYKASLLVYTKCNSQPNQQSEISSIQTILASSTFTLAGLIRLVRRLVVVVLFFVVFRSLVADFIATPNSSRSVSLLSFRVSNSDDAVDRQTMRPHLCALPVRLTSAPHLCASPLCIGVSLVPDLYSLFCL